MEGGTENDVKILELEDEEEKAEKLELVKKEEARMPEPDKKTADKDKEEDSKQVENTEPPEEEKKEQEEEKKLKESPEEEEKGEEGEEKEEVEQSEPAKESPAPVKVGGPISVDSEILGWGIQGIMGVLLGSTRSWLVPRPAWVRTFSTALANRAKSVWYGMLSAERGCLIRERVCRVRVFDTGACLQSDGV
ncbi:hypothetical protein scyTo_0026914 [Scyliorhinus torazame]|uniref:Uncharacterized protein n=1 Tax=Scyliorhinus torazame TaxID=75743 RepID=A0A401QL99_SCYTO|nr:hypothetical protein [Scyliorhinus torazame]